jgi:transcriptional regulator with XRE-family HTH domain
MLESFGARLRRRREDQDIDLLTIAKQTKIKVSLLEALERDEVSQWPSGFYRRAFIRAYAQAVGLDPEVTIREFQEAHPEPPDTGPTFPTPSEADGSRSGSGPPTRLRNMVGSAIGSLSRLRRGPAAEEVAIAGTVPVSMPAPVESVPTMTEPALVPPAPLPERIETANVVVVEAPPGNEPASSNPDFQAVADLCTEFGRVENTDDVQPLLREAAKILDAIGLIVWVWDASAAELRPALAHGYSEKVLAQLPTVKRDADNPTAAAFRSGRACTITGGGRTRGALVVPLLTPAGCAGVLAIELRPGHEHAGSVRAAATIFAALLAQLIGGAPPAEIQPQDEAKQESLLIRSGGR